MRNFFLRQKHWNQEKQLILLTLRDRSLRHACAYTLIENGREPNSQFVVKHLFLVGDPRLDSAALSGPERRLTFPSQQLEPSLRWPLRKFNPSGRRFCLDRREHQGETTEKIQSKRNGSIRVCGHLSSFPKADPSYSEFTDAATIRLYVVRNEQPGESCLVQVTAK